MSIGAALADELAREIVDRVPELAALAGGRRATVREQIAELAEYVIYGVTEAVLAATAPGEDGDSEAAAG